MEKDYVTAETLVLVKDLLRKWSHDCIEVVGSVSSKTLTEPKAKSALVWMLGEYDMPVTCLMLPTSWRVSSKTGSRKTMLLSRFLERCDTTCRTPWGCWYIYRF